MLKDFVPGKHSILEDEIIRVRREMLDYNVGTQEYEKLLEIFERLILLQKQEKSNRVSPDTIAIVAGNLLGILIVVGYERMHVITSRGLGFILRTNHQ